MQLETIQLKFSEKPLTRKHATKYRLAHKKKIHLIVIKRLTNGGIPFIMLDLVFGFRNFPFKCDGECKKCFLTGKCLNCLARWSVEILPTVPA